VTGERQPSGWSTGGASIAQAEQLAAGHLALLDRSLPGWVVGLYLVGSSALGAFDPDHSDLDLIVVVDRPLRRFELARLRMVHVLSAGGSVVRSVARRRFSLPETCNAAYVLAEDLRRPVTEIVPVASHTGGSFSIGTGFDVNPVMWKVLAERGVAIRGRAPSTLGLDPQPELLRAWNLDNLDGYWRSWGEHGLAHRRLQPAGQSTRWTVAWGVLGAPRLHCTIATGEVVSKIAAGEYALDVFEARWRPILAEGLAHRRGEPLVAAAGDARSRRRQAAEFVLEVVADAHRL
jgi:hypothetical protein